MRKNICIALFLMAMLAMMSSMGLVNAICYEYSGWRMWWSSGDSEIEGNYAHVWYDGGDEGQSVRFDNNWTAREDEPFGHQGARMCWNWTDDYLQPHEVITYIYIDIGYDGGVYPAGYRVGYYVADKTIRVSGAHINDPIFYEWKGGWTQEAGELECMDVRINMYNSTVYMALDLYLLDGETREDRISHWFSVQNEGFDTTDVTFTLRYDITAASPFITNIWDLYCDQFGTGTPWDVVVQDGKCDIYDVAGVASAGYGKSIESLGFYEWFFGQDVYSDWGWWTMDVTVDGEISIFDVVLVCSKYGWTI